MSIQQRLKCLKQSAKRREHRGIISAILLNFKISIILFLTSYFLFPASHLAFAGGMVYWTPDGVLVNNFNDGGGSPVDDAKGGAILFSVRPYGIGQDSVVALRIDRNGNSLWGLQGRTLDNYAGWQGWVKGVSDGRGGAIAFWARFPSEIYYYQRVDSMGNRMWGSNAQRVTLSDSAQRDPTVVSDGAGGVIITWYEYWNWDADIYAQRIDSSGTRLWGDYGVLVCAADSNQTYPTITCDSGGNSVVAWMDYRNGEYDIFAQRLDNTGSPLWQLNGIAVCDTDSVQTFSWGFFSYGKVLTMATDTTVIITWMDKRNGNWDVYAQNLNATGLPLWTSQGIPVCDTIDSQASGQLAPDGKGGVVFCWVDERTGFKNIYAQCLDKNGQRLWANQGVQICNTDSAYWYQRIVSDGNSGAIICWQDKRSGYWDIYAQHVDSSGTVLWDTNGMAVCTAINDQQYQEMIASDSNTAIICWLDYRNGSSQARGYAQKVGDIIVGITEKMQDARYKIQDVRLQVYPNPFTKKTDIRYMIHDTGFIIKNISLKIYDAAGRLMKSFTNLSDNQVIWDGKNDNGAKVCSGVYFCVLATESGNFVKKILFVKQ